MKRCKRHLFFMVFKFSRMLEDVDRFKIKFCARIFVVVSIWITSSSQATRRFCIRATFSPRQPSVPLEFCEREDDDDRGEGFCCLVCS